MVQKWTNHPKMQPKWSVGLMGTLGQHYWNWKLNHSLHCVYSYGCTCLYIICPHICQHYYSWLLWHLGTSAIFQWKEATFFVVVVFSCKKIVFTCKEICKNWTMFKLLRILVLWTATGLQTELCTISDSILKGIHIYFFFL